MNKLTALLASGVMLLLVGCPSFPDGVICTDIFVYGLNATLTDSEGNPVTGATLTLSQGDFTETMMEWDAATSPGVYVGAGERAGTYTLSIEGDGFDPATVNDIVVTADECHVIPVNLTVPLPPV